MAPPRPRLFWDSSALIAALMSPRNDSPGRTLIRLGEAGVLEMRLSGDVLRDADWVLRARRRPDLLADLASALDRAGFVAVPEPNPETVDACATMTGYWADARVLAAAEECGADLLVTNDRQHFVGNPLVGPPATRCRATTPHEALELCRERLRQSRSADEDAQSGPGDR